MEFPTTKRQHPGTPLISFNITNIATLRPGDHVLYRVGKAGYRYDLRSGMVSDIDLRKGKLSIITLTAKGCREGKFCFKTFPPCHRIEYSPCRFSANDAISRARRRRDMNDQLYNPLNNNGHHFVTNAKTGQEYSLSDIIFNLKNEGSEEHPYCPKPVTFQRQLDSISDIQPGQHLLIKTGSKQQHVLAEACNCMEEKFTAFIFEGKIKKIAFEFSQKGRKVFEVMYEKEFCLRFSADIAIKRAEEAMQLQEEGMIHISEKDEGYPGISKKCTSSSPHNESHQPQPYESYYETPRQEAENKTDFLQREKWKHTSQFVTAVKTEKPLTINESCLFEHDVSPVNLTPASAHSPLDEGDHVAIEIENNEYHHAIVLMNIESKGLLIIPNLNQDPHAETGISEKEINPGFVKLSSTAYRVNYNQSVSLSETKKRAFSQMGQQILNEKGEQYFATWAKTGNSQQVDMHQLRSENETIKQIRPLFKERITSLESIKEGDHLIESYPTHWFHFMISEIISTESHQKGIVKGIYCLRTKVVESEFPLHVHDDKIYRIQYAETFPPEKAIRRAREEVGKRRFDPHDRMQFVRWAKTGSDEDIAVEFLKNLSLPFSKSQIQSFAQLNEGDIVVKKETLSLARYYIITEVVTANICRAVESFFGIKSVILSFEDEESSEMFYRLNYYPEACFQPEDSVELANHLAHSHSRLKHILLKGTKFINYVKTGDSGSIDSDTLINDRLRSVEYESVHSACKLLPGDHIIRPLDIKFNFINKASATKKESKEKTSSSQFHHMMVADKTEKEEECYVFHFAKEKGGKENAIIKTEENIFKCGKDVYRVMFPERLNPKSSLQFLANRSQASEEQTISLPPSQDDEWDEATQVELDERSINEHEVQLLFNGFKQTKKNPEKYSLFSHNCEHLIMLVSVLSPVSSQVINLLYRYLEYHSEIPYKAIQAAFIRQAMHLGKKGPTTLAVQGTKFSCHKVGARAGTAIAKTVLRTAIRTTISEGAETAADTVITAGYATTLRTVSGAVGGSVAAFGANIIFESPICIRSVYKLKRKEKFGQISSTKYKTECAKTVATSTGSVIGGTAGAFTGSLIPVPVVGTAVGAAAGTVIGMAAGNAVGRCIGMAFKEPMKPNFAVLDKHLYTEYY